MRLFGSELEENRRKLMEKILSGRMQRPLCELRTSVGALESVRMFGKERTVGASAFRCVSRCNSLRVNFAARKRLADLRWWPYRRTGQCQQDADPVAKMSSDDGQKRVPSEHETRAEFSFQIGL